MPTLKVTLIEGRNLVARDITGSSDPFAVLQIGSHSFKSRVIERNLAPKWNEVFTFTVPNPSTDTLSILLFDSDKGLLNANDPMGKATFSLKDLEKGKVTDMWQTLQGVPRGEIHVSLLAEDFGVVKNPPPQQGGYPPQGYPPQGYPPQGYPPQGYPPQGYPPQGYPPQGYPPQGYPPQGYPPQGYPPQGYPPQQQGYPPGAYVAYPPGTVQQPGYPTPPGYPPGAYPSGAAQSQLMGGGFKKCSKCSGTGVKPPKKSKKGGSKGARPCKKCSGSGRVPD